MSRTERIAKIIAKRQPLAKKITEVEENLNSISYALHYLEDYRNQLLATVEDISISGKLQAIDFAKIQLSLVAELEALSKLKARFSRNTLNIGVIGRARQGKSRLLQSLTKLTAAEIPDGSGEHCTGVRSTIYHNPAFETYGEVTFHTERSFLDEVIAPYYEQLKLGAKPITLGEFATQPLPSLPSNFAGAEGGAKYEHLRGYHKNIDKYRHLFREISPRRISRDEIRAYVAQDNLEGERIYFNYVAVKDVKIVCKFPNDDVGQIALVDLPGLGDTGIGDEERMVKTIGQEVDAVLFVRMPKPSGDFWGDVDVKLYDTARSALTDLPIEQWSFMVLNRTDRGSNYGDNASNCERLTQSITDKHIKLVECITANCADPDEANNKVLDRVVDYLATEITSLDKKYASSCQERLEQLQSAIDAELDKAKNALGQPIQSAETSRFEVLFKQLWEQLTTGLEILLKELSKQIDKHDRDFKEAVEAAIKACYEDTKLPSSIEGIEVRRNVSNSYETAYNEYLNEIRAHISKHFLTLDEGLKNSLNRVKSQVAQVLIEKGNLGGLTEVRGADFVQAIAKLLPDDLIGDGQPCRIKFGFQILAEFELSYRGMIQHRIRKCLNDLSPDTKTLKLPPNPNAQQVMSNLKALHGEAVYQCETALDELLCEPSQAGFAIVEEFLDRVLRADEVEIEWRIFLREERAAIWPDEFELLGERTRLRREWLEAIEKVAIANQLDSMKFLN
ncbi:hypothetical protein CLI64_17745 [Nostoc sp. CENA543]|uniref:hypothetical protein n=1 Tax=Nostoc sp. CENA543 TaxID=1869241 RepID=UPI000CA3EF3A|nr:hypothetical protein [Nostoc sp. CENA543]AUT02078.1 hypothetical protein CLI64_17745 [Nostoc sp. CENA543]